MTWVIEEDGFLRSALTKAVCSAFLLEEDITSCTSVHISPAMRNDATVAYAVICQSWCNCLTH